jgi:tRNA A-37 threonylcarbamoyl transferase component Bud32
MNSCVVEQGRPEFTHTVRGPYLISSRSLITEEQATMLVQMLRAGCDVPARSVLGGRSQSCVYQLPGVGRIFVKHYSHGGLLRSVTAGRFISLGAARSQVEFEMLEFVRALGVNAPKPLAIIKRGALVYGTWLVMEELLDVKTLVEIQQDDGDELHRAMAALADQLRLLIKHRILHVDLHPGNVLVKPDGTVFIVDFDKARHFRGSAHALRDLYLRRWRRAVIKHGLSPVLSEMMSLTLRSYNE